MTQINTRALDFNLLPVLIAVAETGSVTAAAARLYLTQSAVSAALTRLRTSIGEPIVTRHGRGIVLTERGARLVADAKPHLEAIANAAMSPPRFDPTKSDQIVRLGLDNIDEAILPPLLQLLRTEAPNLRLVCTPIQFRTIREGLATRRIDLAVAVADPLPASVARQKLADIRVVCLFDPRFVRLGTRPTERAYFAQDHVIVSFNGDLRGTVEDKLGRVRRVKCSVPSFSTVGAILDGSNLVATVPDMIAEQITALRPHLRTAKLPFALGPFEMDLLWPTALDTDPACRFIRDAIVRVVNRRRARQ